MHAVTVYSQMPCSRSVDQVCEISFIPCLASVNHFLQRTVLLEPPLVNFPGEFQTGYFHEIDIEHLEALDVLGYRTLVLHVIVRIDGVQNVAVQNINVELYIQSKFI